jgi:hypothetical protein
VVRTITDLRAGLQARDGRQQEAYAGRLADVQRQSLVHERD